jgi:guanosine-3',5'-bis(diphosphate) 3'-pyrophosphohydrolase
MNNVKTPAFCSTEMLKNAFHFSRHAHAGQWRKYSNQTIPYHSHCIAVAGLVCKFGGDEEMIAAGLLHDTVEDTSVTPDDVRGVFGSHVANLVLDLTNPSQASDGNRATRKSIDLAHTAKAHPRAKAIKAADLVSNLVSIANHDKNFAMVYLREKQETLRIIKDGALPALYDLAVRTHSRSLELVYNDESEIAQDSFRRPK